MKLLHRTWSSDTIQWIVVGALPLGWNLIAWWSSQWTQPVQQSSLGKRLNVQHSVINSTSQTEHTEKLKFECHLALQMIFQTLFLTPKIWNRLFRSQLIAPTMPKFTVIANNTCGSGYCRVGASCQVDIAYDKAQYSAPQSPQFEEMPRLIIMP